MSTEDELKRGKITLLRHADIMKCPHAIIMSEHYNADGSCKCNDPNATVMAEWGYKWDGSKWTSDEV